MISRSLACVFANTARWGSRPAAIVTIAIALGTIVPVATLRAAAPTSRPAAPAAPSAALAKYDKPIDQSIDKALAYLAKAQQPDGTFAGPMARTTGVNSLCVMAFLAKGHTPGNGPYGTVINKGLDFTVASAQPNGMLLDARSANGPMYSHCISTLLLSEVSGMVDANRQKRIDRVLGPAIKLLLTAQGMQKPAAQQGGWRYQTNSRDSDISCTGWALMSLRSARNAGAAVPKTAVDDAIKFVMNCHNKDGGFAYQPGGQSSLARTGTALLCLELAGRHRDATTLAAGDYILKSMPKSFGGGYFFYGTYYASQGMYQLGGDHWERFAVQLYDMMLKFQRPDGSWPESGGSEQNAGPCYATAMSVLAMSVSYCQLPIYQR